MGAGARDMVIQMQGIIQAQLLVAVQEPVAVQNLHNLHPRRRRHQHFQLRHQLQLQRQLQYRLPLITVGEMKVSGDRMDEQAPVVVDVAAGGAQSAHQQMKRLQIRHQQL